MNDRVDATPNTRRQRQPGLVGLFIHFFDDVWLGIGLMLVIFLYMTVASAGLLYPTSLNILDGDNWRYMLVRKHPALDMTEMEVFAWWPFAALLGLFTINMIVVTVKRIRFNALNLGVWMIHTGIVILAVSSAYYFRTKIEGDTPVFRRHIDIAVPGLDEHQRLVVRPDNRRSIVAPNGVYDFHIQSINPAWPILSGDDAGKTACSVNVAVTTPTQSFIRQMLIGYPQYTEDVIPGKGRAIKVAGTKLLDEDLNLSMAYEPTTRFYIKDSAALYVRELGSTEWIERPIEGLPHYADRVDDLSEFWQPPGDPAIRKNPLNIHVPAIAADDPLSDIDVRVVGRLHYVGGQESRWVGGGDKLNPLLTLRLDLPTSNQHIQLAAFDPNRNTDAEGMFGFVWAQTPEQVEQLAASVGSWIDIRVPEAEYGVSISVDQEASVAEDPDAPFMPLGETGWSYRLRGEQRNLQLGQDRVSLAVMEFRNGDRTFTRWVADRPERTRDVAGEHGMAAPDPALVTTYRPGASIVFIGGPSATDLQAVINAPDNRTPLSLGTPLPLSRNISVTATELQRSARLERRMTTVPKRLRDSNAGEFFSHIKLELVAPGGAEGSPWKKLWMRYHRYPLATDQYAGRRFLYQPTVLTLPDGKKIEMMFSRRQWPLPAAVALEDFELKTHVGGFVPGNTTSVRDFVSVLRTYRDGQWGEPFTASLNSPGSDGGYYFFQSEWDPGNMAYTGLGVGNRNGVYIQLFGCCVSVAGMIYVFYVKPTIKRRRRKQVWQQVASERKEAPRAEPVAV